MSTTAPEKIHLIPDEFHIEHVGEIAGGNQFLVAPQLSSDGNHTQDYVCTFVFDGDGRLVSHVIEHVGTRGQYEEAHFQGLFQKALDALGERVESDIWIRPFKVESNGQEFGFVVRLIDEPDNPPTEDDWRVEFMPGNTMSFYAPWDAGGYDT